MNENKMNHAESGSLYMTLDAFYKPVYLSLRGRVRLVLNAILKTMYSFMW